MSLGSRLNKTATIERPTEVRGPTGEVTLTWAESSADVPCFLDRLSGESRQLSLARGLEVSHVVMMETSADVRPAETNNGLGDRLKIDGVYYLAQFVDDVAGQGKHLEIYVDRSA